MADVKILLVEDENIEALDIKLTLESFGYEVPYVASSGEEVVEKALEIMPDLILMDIVLKGDTDGIDVASKIKNLNIPVIYLTAHSEESTIERAKLTEPDGYIIKPYDRTELKYAIELAIYKNKLKNKLKDSETKYHTLFNQAADGILLIEGDKFIECNDRALEIYGTNGEQLIGKTPYLLFSPEVQPNKEISEDMAIRYINKALDGYPQHFEWEHLQYDGTSIYTEISLNRLKIKGQYLLQAIVRDITDRKQAENELEKSYNREQYLADIIRNATVSIGTGYPDGRLGFVNNAFEKLTGYSEEELKTIKWNHELTPEKWRLTEKKCLDELQHSKKSVQYEKEYRKKDGSIVPIEIVVNPHLDSKGNIDHYFSFITDITERNKIQNDLKASEGLLRGLFDNMPSGMSVYKVKNNGSKGCDYIIQEFNKYSQRIEGMKRKEVIGKSLYDIRPNIDEYGIIPIFKKVWETDKPIKYPSKIYVDENYSNYYENYIFKAPTGEVVAIYNDVTEEEKTKEKIQKSLDEKEVLLREVHHRVKNNMQIVASLLRLQECNVNEKETLDVLKETEGRIKSMAAIHEKLYQSPNFKDIKINEYIEKLVYDILYTYGIPTGTIKTKLILEDKNINIDTAIPLGLIINELVTNSVKYAFLQSKGTLTIKLKSLPQQMELTIADNGIGLPKDIDIENPEKLGLQLVKNLINQLEGNLKLNTDNGTEFKITFQELVYKKRV